MGLVIQNEESKYKNKEMHISPSKTFDSIMFLWRKILVRKDFRSHSQPKSNPNVKYQISINHHINTVIMITLLFYGRAMFREYKCLALYIPQQLNSKSVHTSQQQQ